ncbi:hypothetical protein KEM52_000340 [Ascosphaera acerosa]|nr:hypothetical protein KEM52_000340 [Ascosphaera acerosa]
MSPQPNSTPPAKLPVFQSVNPDTPPEPRTRHTVYPSEVWTDCKEVIIDYADEKKSSYDPSRDAPPADLMGQLSLRNSEKSYMLAWRGFPFPPSGEKFQALLTQATELIMSSREDIVLAACMKFRALVISFYPKRATIRDAIVAASVLPRLDELENARSWRLRVHVGHTQALLREALDCPSTAGTLIHQGTPRLLVAELCSHDVKHVDGALAAIRRLLNTQKCFWRHILQAGLLDRLYAIVNSGAHLLHLVAHTLAVLVSTAPPPDNFQTRALFLQLVRRAPGLLKRLLNQPIRELGAASAAAARLLQCSMRYSIPSQGLHVIRQMARLLSNTNPTIQLNAVLFMQAVTRNQDTFTTELIQEERFRRRFRELLNSPHDPIRQAACITVQQIFLHQPTLREGAIRAAWIQMLARMLATERTFGPPNSPQIQARAVDALCAASFGGPSNFTWHWPVICELDQPEVLASLVKLFPSSTPSLKSQILCLLRALLLWGDRGRRAQRDPTCTHEHAIERPGHVVANYIKDAFKLHGGPSLLLDHARSGQKPGADLARTILEESFPDLLIESGTARE